MSENDWQSQDISLKELQWPSPFPLFLLKVDQAVKDWHSLTMTDNDCLGPCLLEYANLIWKNYETVVRAQGQGGKPKAYNISFTLNLSPRQLEIPVFEDL